MRGMRRLRSLVLAIVISAGLAAILMSRDLTRHHDIRPEDPFGATMVSMPAGGPLLVDSLRSGGEAEQAGLRVGDRIDAVDSRRPRSTRDVEKAFAAHHQVSLQVRRGGRTVALTVTSHRS